MIILKNNYNNNEIMRQYFFFIKSRVISFFFFRFEFRIDKFRFLFDDANLFLLTSHRFIVNWSQFSTFDSWRRVSRVRVEIEGNAANCFLRVVANITDLPQTLATRQGESRVRLMMRYFKLERMENGIPAWLTHITKNHI